MAPRVYARPVSWFKVNDEWFIVAPDDSVIPWSAVNKEICKPTTVNGQLVTQNPPQNTPVHVQLDPWPRQHSPVSRDVDVIQLTPHTLRHYGQAALINQQHIGWKDEARIIVEHEWKQQREAEARKERDQRIINEYRLK